MQFIIMLALMLIMELTRPVPKPPARAGLGDFSAPTAEQDRPIPVFWGKPWLSAPNLVWYGDIRTKAITVKIKGLFISKKQTVGWRYFLGMHLVFGYGDENTRLLHRAIFWAAAQEQNWAVWNTTNIRTECAYFQKSRKLVVINNAGEKQDTVITLAAGKTSKKVSLEAHGIAILDV